MALKEALETGPEDLRGRALAPVEVAILDTGIDATHPDLAGRVVEAFEIDPDGGGTAAAPLANNDKDGHGTGVASVVAAIAPNARLVDIQIIGADAAETGAAFVRGLDLAVLRRQRVINCSLTCHGRFFEPVRAACEQAFWQKQVVVAARHNNDLLEFGLPAQLAACIGVDAGRLASPDELRYRDAHPIEFVARGEDVRVALPGGGHALRSGTSFAAPAVAGLCALILGAFPELTPFEVRAVLRSQAARSD